MGLELAKVWVRIRADGSQLKGDFSNAQKVAIDQSRKISNIINNNITVNKRGLPLQFKALFAGIGAGLGVAGLTKHMFGLAGALEKTEASMTVMLGSTKKAKDIIQQVRDLSLESPFSFEELTENTKKMLAYGVAAEDLVKTVKALGSISAAAGADFGRLALAYGQVKSLGKLQGQETRQFTEAMVPLVQLLATSMGKTTTEILKMREAGKISFTDVQKVVFGLSEGTGRFTGMLVKMSKTMSGSFQVMKNYFNFILTDIGTSLIPMVKGLINIMIALGDQMKKAFNVVNGPLTAFSNNLGDIFNTVANNLQLSWDVVVSAIEAKVSYLKDIFTNLWQNIGTIFSAGWKAILAGLKGFKNMAVQVFIAMVGEIEKRLTQVISKFYDMLIEQLKQQSLAASLVKMNPFSQENITRAILMFQNAQQSIAKAVNEHPVQPPSLIEQMQSTAAEMRKAWKDEMQGVTIFQKSDLTKEADTLAGMAWEVFKGAWNKVKQARIAAENEPDINRNELLPDVGDVEAEKKKRKKKSNSLVGIAELGKQIQQNILDDQKAREEEMIKLQKENNGQNQEVVKAVKEVAVGIGKFSNMNLGLV